MRSLTQDNIDHLSDGDSSLTAVENGLDASLLDSQGRDGLAVLHQEGQGVITLNRRHVSDNLLGVLSGSDSLGESVVSAGLTASGDQISEHGGIHMNFVSTVHGLDNSGDVVPENRNDSGLGGGSTLGSETGSNSSDILQSTAELLTNHIIGSINLDVSGLVLEHTGDLSSNLLVMSGDRQNDLLLSEHGLGETGTRDASVGGGRDTARDSDSLNGGDHAVNNNHSF